MEFTTCCTQTNALRRNRYVSKLPKTYFSNHSKYLDSRSKTFTEIPCIMRYQKIKTMSIVPIIAAIHIFIKPRIVQ